MIFKIDQTRGVPESGVTVELKPTGKMKEGWTGGDIQQGGGIGRLRQYSWVMSAFTGQHGNPFGEIWAKNIDQAYEECRVIALGILRRKRAYEEFHERRA